MPGPAPADDEALLERLLTGNLDPDDPAVKARLDGDPALAARLERVLAFEREMESYAEGHRDAVAAAGALSGAPGEERVAASVAAFVVEARRASRARWWGVAAGLAAAAAFVAVFLLVRAAPDSAPDGASRLRYLGDSGPASLAPAGPVPEYSEFSWTLPLPADGWFVVRVFEEGCEPGARALFESKGLDSPALTLPPNVARALPDAIEWHVEAYDASGELSAVSSRAHSSRSPPAVD
jgi:hypothetical protein